MVSYDPISSPKGFRQFCSRKPLSTLWKHQPGIRRGAASQPFLAARRIRQRPYSWRAERDSGGTGADLPHARARCRDRRLLSRPLLHLCPPGRHRLTQAWTQRAAAGRRSAGMERRRTIGRNNADDNQRKSRLGRDMGGSKHRDVPAPEPIPFASVWFF